MKLRLAVATTLFGLGLAGTAPADPLPGDTRIMDPAEITALGFNPVTDEVWRAPTFDHDELLAARIARDGASPQTLDPLVDPIWTSVAGPDFQFRGQNALTTFNSSYSVSCQPGSPVRTADAAIEFPNDHRITWMDVWAIDDSATAGVETTLWEICQRVNDPDSSLRTVVQLGVVDTGVANAPGPLWGNTHVGPNRWVHSTRCSYMVRATFSACEGSSVRLQKVRVLWDYD
ncbi:hypothetical protein [Dokdonella sp.]|uniref:hypothetical protein n=1 Tax=Dokdonella sp. TaxID=2291710 RepID=UPI0031BD963E|nr:hypothetical protein [Dokdonella sp.]